MRTSAPGCSSGSGERAGAAAPAAAPGRGKRRTTMSDAAVEQGTNAHKRAGVFFGQW
ncbi:hypothetical protein AX27061_4362 [Achromobacter xylosoxidans NBRC 15126 = ATCC 27061]|nr:hypothetical protein AX27061_4362 [Achromobacter xylosoxidans NBRC 15126 = ATCC 27061]